MQISRIRLSDKTSRRLSRATPSAASEHHLELIGCPISMPCAVSCVCLELRSLPSTRVTRCPRYYEPLRHPMSARPVPHGRPVGPVIPAGSVATIGSRCAGAVGELSPPGRSCGAIEQVGDDDGLAPDIMIVNLSKLSLPHHRHRFETRQSSPRGMETAEAEPRPHKALDTPVVLLNDVVQIFALSQTRDRKSVV